MTTRRYGAYVLPGDPTWLERTLPRYYPLLDALVVPLPVDGKGWTGSPIPVDECLDIVRAIDTRGLLELVPGTWSDPVDPLRADTAQRQAAVDRLSKDVDWIVQLDNDELLPEPRTLVAAIDRAEELGLGAVELPMRVLFRRTRRTVLEVVAVDGSPRYEYPGAVAVRSGTTLSEARRTNPYLRVTVDGDDRSLQLRRPAEPGETRSGGLRHEEAIVHDSWARDATAIRAKIRTWGHANDAPLLRYYWTVWWPSPVTWRLLRDVHPFSRGLWPRLRPTTHV